MTTTDTNVQNLIINTLTKDEYDSITPSATELYMITDEVVSSSDISSALGYTPQAALTAGDNIQITGNTISATDTTYFAGDGILINPTSHTIGVSSSVVRNNNTGGQNLSIGDQAQAQGSNGIVIGTRATIPSQPSVGYNITDSIVLGVSANAAASFAVVLGSGAKIVKDTVSGVNTNGIAIGNSVRTKGNNIIIGAHSNCDNNMSAVAIGQEAVIGGSVFGGATAVGTNAYAKDDGVAFGGYAKAKQTHALAIGNSAVADAEGAIQLGYWGSNSVAETMAVAFGLNKNYQLLDGSTGKIPTDRLILDSTVTDASTNAVTSGAVYTALGSKQDSLSAGNNISISNGTISATDTTYAAGNNISISNGTISSTASVVTFVDWTV